MKATTISLRVSVLMTLVIDELDVRNGLPGAGGFGHGYETQLIVRDEIRVHVGEKLGVWHRQSPFG
jgi:hypothetical protein